jgi:hypothetical protein
MTRSSPRTEIRFGVRSADGRFRSGTFRLWTNTNPDKDDVYIVSREVGRDVKVSLHETGQWHLKIEPTGGNVGRIPHVTERWSRPAPFSGGITKAFGIVVPTAAVRTPISNSAAVSWVTAPPVATQFTVLLTAHGMRVSSWPGARGMGTALVGKIPLRRSGEMVWVVSHALDEVPIPKEFRDGQARTFPLPNAEAAERLRAAAMGGSLKMLVFGHDDDGMWWFMDAPTEAKEGS